jgi:hypothetical protein
MSANSRGGRVRAAEQCAGGTLEGLKRGGYAAGISAVIQVHSTTSRIRYKESGQTTSIDGVNRWRCQSESDWPLKL